MTTEQEIKTIYKALHDELTEAYYGGTSGLTKEDFDTQHGQIWDDMKARLIAEGYLTLPQPSPDETRLQDLLSCSPTAITMPDIWEALRLLGKLHGITT